MLLCFTFHYSLLVIRSEQRVSRSWSDQEKASQGKAKVFSPTVKCNLADRIKIFEHTKGALLTFWRFGALALCHSPRRHCGSASRWGRGRDSWACCHSICKGKVTRWLREFYDLNAIYGANSKCHRHKARRQSLSLQSQPRAGAGVGPGNQTVWRCRALPCWRRFRLARFGLVPRPWPAIQPHLIPCTFIIMERNGNGNGNAAGMQRQRMQFCGKTIWMKTKLYNGIRAQLWGRQVQRAKLIWK